MKLSVPTESIRDRDMVVDRYGRVHQVIGSLHPQSWVYAISKYIPTRAPTLWKKGPIYLKRLFHEYTPLIANISQHHCSSWEYKSVFPCVHTSEILSVIFPEKGVERLISSTKDELERDALSLLNDLVTMGITSLSRLGITGSLLGGFQNSSKSDIDIIIYDRNLPKGLSTDVGKPFTGGILREWIRRNSVKTGLSPRVIAALYDPRRRFVYKNRLVTILLAPPRESSHMTLEEHFSIKGEYIGLLEAILTPVDKTQVLSEHYYPHVTYFVLESIVRGHKVKPGIMVKLVSFESLFSGFHRFRRVYARAKAFYHSEAETLFLVVGTREEKTFAAPLNVMEGNQY